MGLGWIRCLAARRAAVRALYAAKHHHGSGHPIVASFEPGEARHRCHADEVVMEIGR